MKNKFLIILSILILLPLMVVYAQVENIEIESVTNQTFIISQPNIQDSLDFITYIQLANARANDLDSVKSYNVIITFQELINIGTISSIFPDTITCSGSVYYQDSSATNSFISFHINPGNNITFENPNQIDSSTNFFAIHTSLQGVVIKQLWSDDRLLCLDVGPINYLQTYPHGWIIVSSDLYELSQQFDPNNLAKSLFPNTENQTVDKFYLYTNYPNPFNPSTTIKYQIPDAGFVTLKVYDVLGNEIALLVNEQQQAGRYEINFDASNLSSGVYIYKISVSDFVDSKDVLLMIYTHSMRLCYVIGAGWGAAFLF